MQQLGSTVVSCFDTAERIESKNRDQEAKSTALTLHLEKIRPMTEPIHNRDASRAATSYPYPLIRKWTQDRSRRDLRR